VTKNKKKIEEYHLHKDQPEKLQFDIFSLNEYLKESIGLVNKPHIHSFYQIIWFTKGDGKHLVDFNEFEVSENKIFFISKNQIHCFDSNLDYEGVLIHFNESFLLDNENDIDIFLKYNIFNDFECEPVTIPTEAIEKFGGWLQSKTRNFSTRQLCTQVF
jgi:mannose-6-phosphate isomerase-like protein (cupin superfamily)